MNRFKNESELIKHFKNQTDRRDYIFFSKEGDRIDNADIRYDHVRERIQYFEQEIFEDEFTKLRGKGFSREIAEKRARKKAWIDWLPFLLQNVEVTGKEKEIFLILKKTQP